MALAEFGLIERYFKRQNIKNSSTRIGIGDDCALLNIPSGFELAITTDTMVEKVHFLPATDPESLGHKLLAVNLSDLASMGAKPLSVLLALTLPQADEDWLRAFAKGFLTLAERYQVDLIGGDTTAGPLTLTVQALGLVPCKQALTRSKAQPGDLICMTGLLGEAGLGLKIAQDHYQCLDATSALQRFHRPEPQIAAGQALLEQAHACIDISDGLMADLKHITSQSSVGAEIDYARLPLSPQVKTYINTTGDWSMPLCAGDDYELCFTISPDKVKHLNIPFTTIGLIDSGDSIRLTRDGQTQTFEHSGYEHFS